MGFIPEEAGQQLEQKTELQGELTSVPVMPAVHNCERKNKEEEMEERAGEEKAGEALAE